MYAAARLVLALGGSRVAATMAAILIASNPNLLYLQSTPMTEPLLLGLLALGVTLTCEALCGVRFAPARLGLVRARAGVSDAI